MNSNLKFPNGSEIEFKKEEKEFKKVDPFIKEAARLNSEIYHKGFTEQNKTQVRNLLMGITIYGLTNDILKLEEKAKGELK